MRAESAAPLLLIDRLRPAIARSRPNCTDQNGTSAQTRILTVRRKLGAGQGRVPLARAYAARGPAQESREFEQLQKAG